MSNPDDLPEAGLHDLLGPDWREFDLTLLAVPQSTRPTLATFLGQPPKNEPDFSDFFDLDQLAPIQEELACRAT